MTRKQSPDKSTDKVVWVVRHIRRVGDGFVVVRAHLRRLA